MLLRATCFRRSTSLVTRSDFVTKIYAKRFVARTPHDDASDGIVIIDRREHCGQGVPTSQVQRVALLGAVEDHRGDVAVTLQQDLVQVAHG